MSVNLTKLTFRLNANLKTTQLTILNCIIAAFLRILIILPHLIMEIFTQQVAVLSILATHSTDSLFLMNFECEPRQYCECESSGRN